MTSGRLLLRLAVWALAVMSFVTIAAGAVAGSYAPEQAARGETLFGKYCASCHGEQLQGGAAPSLTGETFIQSWSRSTRTVDDLFYVIRSSMPRPDAGSLTENQYLDLLAFILSRNGVPVGAEVLTADASKLASLRLAAAVNGAEKPATTKKTFIAGEGSMTPRGEGPSAAELRAAATSTDWPYHTHDFRGTRYSPLAQINRANVGHLQVACLYQLGSIETFLTGPIEYRGAVYVTTEKLTAAIDAVTCRERWRYKWEAQDAELWSNNRGVAIEDGYVVRGTADGYLLALDAADGRLLWARQVARPAAGETITMPPLIDRDLIIIGPAGSENNIQGWIGAFRLSDGSPVWRFNTVPHSGERGFETWNHDPSVPVGGGAVWSPMSLDADRDELYVPVTNPAPDFPAQVRKGANLYTDSLLALDARTGKLRWFAQLVSNDSKDWDVTQVSPLVDAQVSGRQHKLVVAGGKDGIIRILDRDTHHVLHETPVGTRLNVDTPITRTGTRYCPGVLGGIEWNGPAFHPGMNALYVPTVDWCTTATLEEKVRLVPGQFYMGGTVKMDQDSSGLLTAIDVSDGGIRWQHRAKKPMVAAVTTTAGGLVFTGETDGDLLALSAEDGTVLYRFNTGGAMTAGLITYSVDAKQYVAAASGQGSFFFGHGKGAPTIIVFTLPP